MKPGLILINNEFVAIVLVLQRRDEKEERLPASLCSFWSHTMELFVDQFVLGGNATGFI